MMRDEWMTLLACLLASIVTVALMWLCVELFI